MFASWRQYVLPCNTQFPGHMQVIIPNGFLDGADVFAGLTLVPKTHRQTDRQTDRHRSCYIETPAAIGCICAHTYTHLFDGPQDFVWDYPSEPLPKPIWLLLKQERVSGSGISWAICKSATRPREIMTPAHHHSDFYMPDALPAAHPTASKH